MRYRRIRDLREDADLSQRQLAKELGMYKTTYANYERGEREIPLNVAIRLAKYYGVSLDYLAGLTNERK
ncbi:helix-turn-helix transcriptional regulator [Christensenellaceae bacterium 44-20]